jgi:hypothetical protein
MNELIKSGRSVGNSTRLADYYIQCLFQNGNVIVKDHYDGRIAHEELLKTILTRLEIEHNGIDLVVDKQKRKITIKTNVRS